MINYIIGLKRRNTLPIAHKLIQKRPDDSYIISYPRSGSTWLRTIITNILVPGANSNPDIFNTVLPGVSLRNIVKINRITAPRIIHSHTWYRQDIQRAVYLVRDGRDVLVSYYHYLVTRRGRSLDEDFQTFFELYSQGVYGHRWHENVESWLGIGKDIMKENLLIVHFEDMKNNTNRVVGKIMRFLNIPTSQSQIEDAIQKSDLDRMRAIEISRIGADLQDPNMSFYRGGISGQWQNMFSSELENSFLDMSMVAMRLGGYLLH